MKNTFELFFIIIIFSPLLILKGIYHYWTYFQIWLFSAGNLSKWGEMIPGARGKPPKLAQNRPQGVYASGFAWCGC